MDFAFGNWTEKKKYNWNLEEQDVHFVGKVVKRESKNEQEKYILEIIFTYMKNKKAKVKVVGKTFSLLTLLVAISKCLSERISEENGVSLERAENIVVDCIKDGMKTLQE